MKIILIGLAILLLFLVSLRFVAENNKNADFINLVDMRLKPGYIWKDNRSTNAKYFWQNTDALWVPRILHPSEKIYTGEIESTWRLFPGYAWLDSSNLKTVWLPGLLHPTYNAFSSMSEGSWSPAFGYQFYGISFGLFAKRPVYDLVHTEQLRNTKIEWTPNISYKNLKVTSGSVVGTWNAFPGYSFVDPANSLKVRWIPGVESPDGLSSASNAEGVWIPKTSDSSETESNGNNRPVHFATAIAGYTVSAIIEKIFGPNLITRDLNRGSAKELIKGVTE